MHVVPVLSSVPYLTRPSLQYRPDVTFSPSSSTPPLDALTESRDTARIIVASELLLQGLHLSLFQQHITEPVPLIRRLYQLAHAKPVSMWMMHEMQMDMQMVVHHSHVLDVHTMRALHPYCAGCSCNAPPSMCRILSPTCVVSPSVKPVVSRPHISSPVWDMKPYIHVTARM